MTLLDDFDRARDDRLNRLRAVQSQRLDVEEPSGGGVFSFADTVLAPFRGVEGAVQDVYGLLDTLALDTLPDYTDRLLGESSTVVGGILESATSFATAFIPVAGWVGKGARVGRTLLAPALAKGGGKLAAAGRGAVAGAVADFAVFDGHEARLSNLIQRYPSLQNPISEFLAADDDDPELFGRLKGSLEGLGLGIAADVLVGAVGAFRAGRRARQAGASPEAVQQAMDDAVPAEALEALNDTPDALRSAEADPEVLKDIRLTDTDVEDALRSVEDQAGAGLEPGVNPRKLSEDELLARHMERGDLNLSQYDGPKDAIRLLRSVEDVFRTKVADSSPLHGAKSLDEQATESFTYLKDLVHSKDEQGFMSRLMADIERDAAFFPHLNARIRAYRTVIQTYSDSTAKTLRQALSAQEGSEAAVLEAKRMLETLSNLTAGTKGLIKEQARGLGGNRVPVRSLDGEAIARELSESGGVDAVKRQVKKALDAYEQSGAAGLTKVAEATRGRAALNMVNEYWINSILSGLRTSAVNSVSGLFTSVYRPLESMLGAAFLRRKDLVADAFQELAGLSQGIPEALRLSKQAFKQGSNILDPRSTVLDAGVNRNAITAENASAVLGRDLDPEKGLGRAFETVGNLVRLPSRFLGASDEFVKQLNFRARAKARFAREAADLGLQGDDAAAFVTDKLDKVITDGQAYSANKVFLEGMQQARAQGIADEAAQREFAQRFARENFDEGLSEVAKDAMGVAEEVTFTTPLQPGTLSAGVQNLVIRHPYLRMVAPFIRTPTNILRFAGQRTLLDLPNQARALVATRFPSYAATLTNTRSRFIKDILGGDERAKADAIGRLMVGAGVTAFVLQKASEGAITGAGPADKEQREALKAAGWLPYSIKVGDQYVSYQRLDPFASMLGLAADIRDYTRFADTEDQGTVEQLATALATSIAKNVTNKSYLTGLANVADALTDPERNAARVLRSYAASFVPSLAGQSVTAAGDPNEKDIRSMLDAVTARVPFFSENVPPRRNVLGEPVKKVSSLGSDSISPIMDMFVPIAYREVSDDLIKREMAELGHGFTPPKRTRNGVDLSTFENADGQDAYDRWGELTGSVKIRNLSLRDSLRKLIKSQQYQRLSPESTHDIDSPRIAALKRVISAYQRAAFAQTLTEFPDLREQFTRVTLNRRALRRGIEQRPEILGAS